MANTEELRIAAELAEKNGRLLVARDVLEFVIQALDGLIYDTELVTKIEKATGGKIARAADASADQADGDCDKAI